jgi:hypothetical protein
MPQSAIDEFGANVLAAVPLGKPEEVGAVAAFCCRTMLRS